MTTIPAEGVAVNDVLVRARKDDDGAYYLYAVTQRTHHKWGS
jgi:hypothetical protein